MNAIKIAKRLFLSDHHRFQIPEIVTFLFLLIIFILAYGVASQALIDPYR